MHAQRVARFHPVVYPQPLATKEVTSRHTAGSRPSTVHFTKTSHKTGIILDSGDGAICHYPHSLTSLCTFTSRSNDTQPRHVPWHDPHRRAAHQAHVRIATVRPHGGAC